MDESEGISIFVQNESLVTHMSIIHQVLEPKLQLDCEVSKKLSNRLGYLLCML